MGAYPDKCSGEGGIRTHGAFRHTRSPGARIRPDYATSPLHIQLPSVYTLSMVRQAASRCRLSSLAGDGKMMQMIDPRTVVAEARDSFVAELGNDLTSLYLFGSAARGDYVPGRSDIDLLLVVDPLMPLVAARDAFLPLWERQAGTLGHGPLVATREDLALHMALFPSFQRILLHEGQCIHGEPVLEDLSPPPPPDPVEEAAYVAARTAIYATALTFQALPPARVERLARALNRLTKRVTDSQPSRSLTPLEATLALHARLRDLTEEMPQFAWHGQPPHGDVPSLLPGCLAFYQREKHLITVLERVDEETLSNVNWREVSAAVEDANALFALATPWQLRIAASHIWVDSLFFGGFDHIWGADILGDLTADDETLLRQLARSSSEQRVEKVPLTYLAINAGEISKLIHDTQNMLLNAGLRAELYARFTDREFALPEWRPPGRETPQHERVAAAWERWRELTAYYAGTWQNAKS
jgi:hypothetical protein